MPCRVIRTSFVIVAALGLTACGTTGQGQGGMDPTPASASYLDKSDACHAERVAMDDQDSFFDEQLVVTTVGGAVVGGVIAALSGHNIGVGAAIGAAVGLAGGYLSKLQGEGMSADQITSRAVSDVSTENTKIEALIGAFDRLSECRKREGSAVQARYEAKEIDRATAEAQMAQVRAKYQEDVAKFQAVAAKISKRSETYAAVYNDIAADNGANELVVKDYSRGVESATVEAQPAKKAAGTETGSLTVSAANKDEVQRLQSECLTNVQRRDDALDRITTAQQDANSMSLDLG